MKEHGSIYGIPLDKSIGFAYVQCIFTGEKGFIPSLMLKVLDHHSESLEKPLNIPTDCEELCYPFLMMGEPVLKGINKWHKIRTVDLGIDETISIPDLREPIGGTSLIDNADWSKITWEVIFNFNYQKSVRNIPYDSIRHLGIWRHSSNMAIKMFLSMIWLRKLGYDVKQYYTEEEIFGRKNFWLRGAFYEAINIVFYSEVPKKYWGKVMPLDNLQPS
jgi:hypothetical protein